jgi:hypothetical protein
MRHSTFNPRTAREMLGALTYHRFRIIMPVLLVATLVLAACGQGASSPAELSGQTALPEKEPTEESRVVWDQLLSRDAIQPIYEPEFVSAGEAGYADGELVIGVAIEGRAKAYPIGLLNSREMVNDELAGTPILVTW